MTTPIEVRRAQPAEHPAVADLTATVYLDEGWGDEAYEQVLRDVDGRARQAQVLVAVTGGSAGEPGRVVGAVAVATRGGPYAERAGDGDAVIRMLVTDPAERGQGIGEALVRACLAAARADGCVRVRLSSQPEMVSAHRVYGRLGFVRAPEHDWQPTPGLQLLGYVLELDGAPVPGGAS